MTTMVLVHGRRQEFKDPDALSRKWRAGLAAGLVKAGEPPVEDIPVVFPFYADTLYRITGELSRNERVDLESLPGERGEPGALHPYVTRDVGELERRLIADMAYGLGYAPPVEEESLRDITLSWRAGRAALEWIADHTHVDETVIANNFRDVAVYLRKARKDVLEIVLSSLPPPDEPIVLVSFSLGTVVACDLLYDPDVRRRTLLWVTAGSPLGLGAVQRNLRSQGAHNPKVPWLNVFDTRDFVALGCPLLSAWKQPLTDLAVDNGDAPHSIERYLGHPQVASAIARAARNG